MTHISTIRQIYGFAWIDNSYIFNQFDKCQIFELH